ncbi:MAG: VWA domain-containing protein [Planctomycetota bacterium]
MFDFPFQMAFERPAFLWLLLLIPLLWYFSYDSLAGLGPFRRAFALFFRTAVVAAIVMALAHAKWEQKTDRLTVIYLLDQSESIPKEVRTAMVDYVIDEVEKHRRIDKKDRAGLIVFGADAKIESAPFDGRLPIINRLETADDIDTGSTSLEAALKLAKASFNEDSASRIVIISDGNENVGDARTIAKSMAEEGVGIDVIPVRLIAKSEVSVEKVVMPSDIRKNEEFQTKIIINNEGSADEEAKPVTGRLKLVRKTAQVDGNSENSSLLLDQEITLKPGKNIVGFDSVLQSSGIFATEAEFVPNDRQADLIPQNNRASAFTRVQGKGRVLLIEDAYNRGEFQHLSERLSANSIEVLTIDTANLYTSAAELLQFDAVILANVARSSGLEDSEQDISGFSDSQIKLLVDNCEKLGCGIIMIGGERSFGAGAWSNTLLEEAMPVDFQIKNDKAQAVGALAMVMHACEMPQGNTWQVKIGEAALDVLGPADFCGVVQYDFNTGVDNWLWEIADADGKKRGVARIMGNKKFMLGRINNMSAGDMPDFNSSLQLMLNGLMKTPAAVKHAIIISDGDPTPASNKLLNQYKQNKIKISTVGVGTHGPPTRRELLRIATVTGGKFWNVTDSRALPKIYQREARRVAKPVIKEAENGLSVIPVPGAQQHEILKGIDVAQLPSFYGYVMTTIKKSSLVEQLAIASEPSEDGGENSTLIASWRYGNGRAIAFTSDAGHRWTSQWFNDAQYDKLFVQMVRYAMRPITEVGDFTVSTEVKDGVARIVITAVNEDEEFLNFLQIKGTGIYSGGQFDAEPVNLSFNQVGPGRYLAEHEIKGGGSLLYSIFPGEGYKKLTSGATIPYSDEYSDRESNLPLLEQLASLEPAGGEAGIVMPDPITPATVPSLLDQNTFRPTLSASGSIQDIWPFLLMLGCAVFFSDVFVRRVSTSLLANCIALMLIPVAVTTYFVIRWIMISNSFDPTESIFFEEPSMPLVIVTLMAFFAALFIAFGLSSEQTERMVQRVKAMLFQTESNESEASISRLKSRKAEVEKEIEGRRAATRFEPDVDDPPAATGAAQLEQVLASEIEKTPALPPKIDQNDSDKEGSYTSRLLDAKRKVQKRRERGSSQDEP